MLTLQTANLIVDNSNGANECAKLKYICRNRLRTAENENEPKPSHTNLLEVKMLTKRNRMTANANLVRQTVLFMFIRFPFLFFIFQMDRPNRMSGIQKRLYIIEQSMQTPCRDQLYNTHNTILLCFFFLSQPQSVASLRNMPNAVNYIFRTLHFDNINHWFVWVSEKRLCTGGS